MKSPGILAWNRRNSQEKTGPPIAPAGKDPDAAIPATVLRSAGNFAIQRISLEERFRIGGSATAAPWATTRDGITAFPAQASSHPLSGLIRAHEAVHRAQFLRAGSGSTAGSRTELEEEAERGARALLSGRDFAVERNAAIGETYPIDPRATWYQRAAAFSSGMEAIGNVLQGVIRKVREEQADIYLISDRMFTHPVVGMILGKARGFRAKVAEFIQASPVTEPLLPQLRTDLAALNSVIQDLADVQPAPIGTAEMLGRGFVGGVTGAAGSFLGFLRLGLWDSWGQLIFDGSERRVDEAVNGLSNMMTTVERHGFSKVTSDWKERYGRSIENEYYTTASQQFGATAFDIYFFGRGLVSAGQGLAGMSRAARMFRAAGNPAPWRAAIWLALRQAVSFRGVGVYSGRGIFGTQYGLPVIRSGVPRVRIIRYISSEQDLVAKTIRQPPELFEGGRPRSAVELAEAHRRASSGSPYQSAYPYADAETMVVANPEGLASSQNAPYYVVLEVPLDEGLVDVNRMVASSSGVNPAQVPELNVSRYGLRLPDELRPSNLNVARSQSIYDPPHAHLPPELQAWARANIAIPESGTASAALEGVPYTEWEQLILASDLRPYVVEVRPNPAFIGTRPAINIPTARGTAFHPALNPTDLYALARGYPQGMGRVTNYLDWLSAQSRLGTGRIPFAPGQIQAGRGLTFFGGSYPDFLFPVGSPGPAIYDLSSQQTPPPSHEVSNEDMLSYLAWIHSTSGQPVPPEFSQLLARPHPRSPFSSPEPMNSAMQAMSASASRLHSTGYRITGLRAGPNLVSLEIHVRTHEGISRAVRAIVYDWGREERNVEAGVAVILDQPVPPGQNIAEPLTALSLPRNFHLRIVSASGELLYSR